ncbi:MAG: methyltransferase [Adlercreutzia equolifaciens]
MKKALEEAGESAFLSVGGDLGRPSAANDDDADAAAEPSDAAEDSSVGGDQGRPSSAGMDETRKSLLVADLCTGSGCIACSLAYEHPDVRVIATDVAPEAVALAKENTEALGLADRVAVLQCSLGSGIGEKRMGTFDAVVSAPYAHRRYGWHSARWRFRPTLALDGAPTARSVPALAQWAAGPEPGGVLACELYEGLDAARLAEQAGPSTHIVDDLTGRPRVLVTKR